jgi:hypothetical protein
MQRDAQSFLWLTLGHVHENSTAVAQMFTGKVPIVSHHFSIDLAISLVDEIDLFIIC